MMTNLTRRGFLNGSTSVILTSKALPFGAFLSSATASSEATAALLAAGLAAAAFAASTIAAHNRGDGGLSAMLSANFELLKIAIVKLDDIQNRLTDVYIKLMSLPSEIDDLLKQEATRKLHVEMLGVVRGYAEKLQNRDPLINFSDWQKDSRTIVDLSDLLARLQKARQEINVQDLADPSTALIASTAGFVETNIKNILGYRIYEITGTIDRVYLPWLDAVMDQGKATSAAGYLLAANERLKQWYAKAADNPIGASLGMKPGNKTLVACTGVNDYTPSYAIKVHRCDPPTIANSWNPQEGKESGNSAVQFQTLAYSRNCGMRITGYTAARVGAKDRLAIDVSLNEAEVIDDGIGTGVLELSAPLGAEIRSEAGAADVPPDKQCQVKTADIPKAEARLSYMKAMKNRKRADTEYTAFAQIIDQINLERGRIAFAAQAIIACQTSRDSLVELKERYS